MQRGQALVAAVPCICGGGGGGLWNKQAVFQSTQLVSWDFLGLCWALSDPVPFLVIPGFCALCYPLFFPDFLKLDSSSLWSPNLASTVHVSKFCFVIWLCACAQQKDFPLHILASVGHAPSKGILPLPVTPPPSDPGKLVFFSPVYQGKIGKPVFLACSEISVPLAENVAVPWCICAAVASRLHQAQPVQLPSHCLIPNQHLY